MPSAQLLNFVDSVARYSHDDWARKLQAESACNAAMRYIALGRPEALPADFLLCFPSHQRPSFSELASKGQLHTTDAGIVLYVRQPSLPPAPGMQRSVSRMVCLLNDEPIRIYVPLLMHPWVMQACHFTASCHLGTACTLRRQRTHAPGYPTRHRQENTNLPLGHGRYVLLLNLDSVVLSLYIHMFTFQTCFCFPASGQAVVTGVVPFRPR